MTTNDELDQVVVALDRTKDSKRSSGRIIPIIAFNEIKLGVKRHYLVAFLLPRVGLVVVWGPPKCGKSFWIFDLMMHVALDWKYRGRRTQTGAVIYCAFEGQSGIEARVEAFRQKHLAEDHDQDIPFYIEPLTLNLVREHRELIAAIKLKLGDTIPAAVVLDTLNRSLEGSESSDEDMTAYVRAADVIREAFECVVVIVHHCGIDGTRPRGHTSLTGACDAQLSVKRDHSDNVIVEVEYAKDGPQGDCIASRLEPITVGTDEDGEAITSCVVVPTETSNRQDTGEPRLTKNQKTVFSILHDAGERGLSVEDWNEKTREAGIGVKRRADLHDIREALKAKGFVVETMNGWAVKQPSKG